MEVGSLFFIVGEKLCVYFVYRFISTVHAGWGCDYSVSCSEWYRACREC